MIHIVIKLSNTKTMIESSKQQERSGMSCTKNSQHDFTLYLIRILGDQKTTGQYIQITEKQLSTENQHPAKLYFRNKGEIKTFPDKQRLREFITIRTALKVMLKEFIMLK